MIFLLGKTQTYSSPRYTLRNVLFARLSARALLAEINSCHSEWMPHPNIIERGTRGVYPIYQRPVPAMLGESHDEEPRRSGNLRTTVYGHRGMLLALAYVATDATRTISAICRDGGPGSHAACLRRLYPRRYQASEAPDHRRES